MRAYSAYYRLFICFAIVYLGSISFISDSEFWSITLAKEFLRSETIHISVYQRPLFFALLKIPHLFPLSNVSHILVVKILFAALGLLAFLQFSKLLRTLGGPRSQWWILLLLGTNTLIVSQFFRVRSDLLALLFLGLQLNWVVKPPAWVKSPQHENLLLLSLSCLIFLCTPKAALLMIANSLFIFFYSREKAFIKALLTSIIPISTLLVVSHFIMIGIARAEWEITFKNAFYIFMLGFFRLKTEALGVTDTGFVERAVSENVIHVIILLGCLIYFIRCWQRQGLSQIEKACITATTYVYALTLYYDQRLPYFLAICVPYLALAPLLALSRIPEAKKKLSGSIILGAIALNGIVSFNCASLWASNKLQLTKIEQLEKFLHEIGPARLFDGQGLLPRGPSTLHFFAPYDLATNKRSLRFLRYNQPEVVVPTPRSRMVFDEFHELVEKNYFHVGGGVWLLKRKYEGSTFSFVNDVELWRIFGFEPDLNYQCL